MRIYISKNAYYPLGVMGERKRAIAIFGGRYCFYFRIKKHLLVVRW